MELCLMYTMRMAREKNLQYVLRYLFLLYFPVYAISPLSQTLAPQTVRELYSSNRAIPSMNSLHIFVWEMIFSKLSGGDNDNNDHEGAGVRILIRKARAILPENIDGKNIFQEKVSLIKPVFYYPSQTLSQYFMDDHVRHTAEVVSLYSGHSPPFNNSQY
jgi:hypothetical protein